MWSNVWSAAVCFIFVMPINVIFMLPLYEADIVWLHYKILKYPSYPFLWLTSQVTAKPPKNPNIETTSTTQVFFWRSDGTVSCIAVITVSSSANCNIQYVYAMKQNSEGKTVFFLTNSLFTLLKHNYWQRTVIKFVLNKTVTDTFQIIFVWQQVVT